MHELKDILYKVSLRSFSGKMNVQVEDLQIDSRKVKKGSAFIAIKGVAADGHQYIQTAIDQGAVAVICEVLPAVKNEQVTYVEVENSAAAAGYMSHNFYGQPSEQVRLIGVTGTNGKTTIATLLFKLFTRQMFSITSCAVAFLKLPVKRQVLLSLLLITVRPNTFLILNDISWKLFF